MLIESEKKWLNSFINKKEILGQVFTPEEIAALMTSISAESSPMSILEPCFGEGVFLKSMMNKFGDNDVKKIGIEIDPDLFNKSDGTFDNIKLLNTDFFQFKEKVDCILMNPPYTRHELLNENMPSFLNKQIISEQLLETQSFIPTKSNLYIYFIIKSWLLLKNDGELVAIIPNTWMASKFGNEFKDFLKERFWIKSVIRFKQDVFPDADVDTCIVHLKKKSGNSNPTNFISIIKSLTHHETNNFQSLVSNASDKISMTVVPSYELETKKNWLNFFNEIDYFNVKDNFVPLMDVAIIKRGITTNYNDFFIFKNDRSEFVKRNITHFRRIVSSPKNIPNYSTNNLKEEHFVFSTEVEKKILPKELKDYVLEFEKAILQAKLPQTIFEKILKKNKKWFHIKNRKTAPILFGYIIRDNKKFYLNETNVLARDNFYEITPRKNVDIHLVFAILNSTITSLALEKAGRSYGKGLLKIQKYELENSLIINPFSIKEKDKELLIKLSKDLVSVEKEESSIVISKINEILLPYVSSTMDISVITELLNHQLEIRTSKKKGHLNLIDVEV